MTERIFISYRRNDSQYATDRIYERLAAHFGADGVFMDIDDIPMGVNFRDYIDQQIGTSDIVIAVIGDHWLNARDQDGNLRLQNPNDFVRLEIEAALNQGIRLIPVFIGGVQSLSENVLPDSLKQLNLINATRIRRSKDFLPDVDKLIKGIEKIHAQQARTRESNKKQLSDLNHKLAEITDHSQKMGTLTRNEEVALAELIDELQTVSLSLDKIITNEELQLRLDLIPYELQTNSVITHWHEFNRKVNERLAIEETTRSQQEREEQKIRETKLIALQAIESSILDTQKQMADVSDLTIEERRLQVRLNREVQFALNNLNRVKESPARLLTVDLDEHEEKVDEIQHEWFELITAIDTRKLDELEKQKQQEKDQEILRQQNEEKLKYEQEQEQQRERERKQELDNKTKRISNLENQLNTTQNRLDQISELTSAEKRTKAKIKKEIQRELRTLRKVLESSNDILQLNINDTEAQITLLKTEKDEFQEAVTTRKEEAKQALAQSEELKPSQAKEKPVAEKTADNLKQGKLEAPTKPDFKSFFSKIPPWSWGILGVIIAVPILWLLIGARDNPEPIALATHTAVINNTPNDEFTPTITQTPAATHTITQTGTTLPTATATMVPTAVPLGIKVNSKDDASMAYIPEGEFLMGSEEFENTQPIHSVYTDAFWMYQYEVTNEMFAAFLTDMDAEDDEYYYQRESTEPYIPIRILNGEWKARSGYEDYPIGVSWAAASYYCEWAGGRLPTEAEWEKAARGGLEGMTYPWGNEEPVTDRNAVNGVYVISISSGFTMPIKEVGLYYPNGYGLYNMADNALEWTSSNAYDYPYDYQKAEEGELLQGNYSNNKLNRIQRGGGQDQGKTAYRSDIDPSSDGYPNSGFRCVFPVSQAEKESVIEANTTITPTLTTTPTITPSPTITPTLGIGSETIREKDGMEMVYVPKGSFTMGSNSQENEKPIHLVTLDSYWIDKFEVTNGQYAQCVADGDCTIPYDISSSTRDSYYGNDLYVDYPVIYVDWYQAQDYCEWAGGSLPTEAQWEKAARGTTFNTYPWGETEPTCNLANFGYDTCIGDTNMVGSYPNGASPYGALDMAGNAWEWVADFYDIDYYDVSPMENPTGPESSEYRVVRGGAWSLYMEQIRVAYRAWVGLDHYGGVFGFRCAFDVEP